MKQWQRIQQSFNALPRMVRLLFMIFVLLASGLPLISELSPFFVDPRHEVAHEIAHDAGDGHGTWPHLSLWHMVACAFLTMALARLLMPLLARSEEYYDAR